MRLTDSATLIVSVILARLLAFSLLGAVIVVHNPPQAPPNTNTNTMAVKRS